MSLIFDEIFGNVTTTANTDGVGDPNVLTRAQSHSVWTNEGSTAENYHTLPTAEAGLVFGFVVQDSDGLRVVANTDDTIRLWGTVSGSAGYISSSTIGSTLVLRAINATEWVAEDAHGVWGIDGTTVTIPSASLPTHTVTTPICLSSYIETNVRNDESNIHGDLVALATAQAVNSGASPTADNGIGKIVLVVNAGTDLAGTVTVTGTSVNRNTGAETGSDTSNITISGTTTDTSGADAQGNVIHGFANAYITDKWFKGTVTISTADVDISDFDVYGIAFEQFADYSGLTLTTYDFNGKPTNANAWVYCYLYTVQVTGSVVDIALAATLSLASGSAVADRYYRLRRGSLATALDGTTDGIFTNVYYGPLATTYWNDVGIKVWGTVDLPVTFS